jgi:hypothetical protein
LNPLFAAALEIQEFCRERSWRFCFIEAMPVQRWGEPRLTQDVDVTVLTGFGGEASFADALLGRFSARIASAHDFALRNRVLLLESGGHIPVDVALGAMPFEERMVERASDYAIAPGATLRTCSAEDLVVLKAFAGREKDWLDVEGIVLRQAERLDQSLVWLELDPLLELKGDDLSGPRLRRLLEG